ncbi:MAG: metal ABC transporter substrate-binding protein [Faecousia sp.]
MNRKKICSVLLAAALLICCLGGCRGQDRAETPVIAATTWPVYQFAAAVCQGTDLDVRQVIGGKISCLHDYTLTVRQMEVIEQADVVILSGCELESFLNDALAGCDTVVECSGGVELLESDEGTDPHIWLDPDNAAIMVQNIADAMQALYPQYETLLQANAKAYITRLTELKQYGDEITKDLSYRELVTFHDGFAYFAKAFDLTILAAIEEEDGATASARMLEQIITLVEQHRLPAIFVETNGSTSAASVIEAETGAAVYTLSMAMSGDDYFTVMRKNLDTLKEALG